MNKKLLIPVLLLLFALQVSALSQCFGRVGDDVLRERTLVFTYNPEGYPKLQGFDDTGAEMNMFSQAYIHYTNGGDNCGLKFPSSGEERNVEYSPHEMMVYTKVIGEDGAEVYIPVMRISIKAVQDSVFADEIGEYEFSFSLLKPNGEPAQLNTSNPDDMFVLTKRVDTFRLANWADYRPSSLSVDGEELGLSGFGDTFNLTIRFKNTAPVRWNEEKKFDLAIASIEIEPAFYPHDADFATLLARLGTAPVEVPVEAPPAGRGHFYELTVATFAGLESQTGSLPDGTPVTIQHPVWNTKNLTFRGADAINCPGDSESNIGGVGGNAVIFSNAPRFFTQRSPDIYLYADFGGNEELETFFGVDKIPIYKVDIVNEHNQVRFYEIDYSRLPAEEVWPASPFHSIWAKGWAYHYVQCVGDSSRIGFWGEQERNDGVDGVEISAFGFVGNAGNSLDRLNDLLVRKIYSGTGEAAQPELDFYLEIDITDDRLRTQFDDAGYSDKTMAQALLETMQSIQVDGVDYDRSRVTLGTSSAENDSIVLKGFGPIAEGSTKSLRLVSRFEDYSPGLVTINISGINQDHLEVGGMKAELVWVEYVPGGN